MLKRSSLRQDPRQEVNDKDYVFIHFILNNLPRGLIGLLLAVILSAAMSSTASELNALAATTTMDLYRRNDKRERTDMYYVKSDKMVHIGMGVYWQFWWRVWQIYSIILFNWSISLVQFFTGIFLEYF